VSPASQIGIKNLRNKRQFMFNIICVICANSVAFQRECFHLLAKSQHSLCTVAHAEAEPGHLINQCSCILTASDGEMRLVESWVH
jgi:hypothetical protein